MKVAYKPGFKKSFCVTIPVLCANTFGMDSTTNMNPKRHVNPVVNPIIKGSIPALTATLIMIGTKVTTAVETFDIILWNN